MSKDYVTICCPKCGSKNVAMKIWNCKCKDCNNPFRTPGQIQKDFIKYLSAAGAGIFFLVGIACMLLGFILKEPVEFVVLVYCAGIFFALLGSILLLAYKKHKKHLDRLLLKTNEDMRRFAKRKQG